MAWLAAISAFVFAPESSPAANLYTDAVRGDDALGDGSLVNPWRTIGHALSQAARGDDVYAAPGVYSAAIGDTFGQVPMCVSLHGDAGGGTVLQGSGFTVLTVNYGDCTGQVVENLNLLGPGSATGSGGIELWPRSGNPFLNGITIRRCRFEQFRRGIFRQSEAWIMGALILDFDEDSVVDGNTFIDVATAISLTRVEHHVGPTSLMINGTTRRTITNNVFIGSFRAIDLALRCDSNVGCGGMLWADRLWNNSFHACDTAIALSAVVNQPTRAVRPEIANNAMVGGNGVAIDLQGAEADIALLSANDFWQWPSGFLRDDVNGTLSTITAVNFFRSSTRDNFEADPAFVDPAAADLHLQDISPCIDRGRDLGATLTDIDRQVRPYDGDGDTIARTDVGADELRPRIHLRRGDFAMREPPSPAIALFFPFGAANPLTPVVRPDFLSGDDDPTPGILRSSTIPMSFYAVDPPPAMTLHAVRDGDSIRFHLR